MEQAKTKSNNIMIYSLFALIGILVVLAFIIFAMYSNANTKLGVDKIQIANYQTQISNLQQQLTTETSVATLAQNQTSSIQSNIQKADKYIAVLKSWYSNDTYAETMNIVNLVGDNTLTYDFQAVIGADASWNDSSDNMSYFDTLMNADNTFEEYVCDTINRILNPTTS